jgi:ribose transport system substrate-binding protein
MARPTPSRVALLAALTLAASLALSACGSSDDDKPAAPQGSSDEIKTQAEAAVKPYTTRPTSIGITEPIQGQIPADKTIAYMNCSLPSCSEIGEIVKDAASVLGWKTVSINIGATPETVKAGWEQAVKLKPDAVIGQGYGPEIYSEELDELNKLDIPVILSSIAENDPRLTALFQEGNTAVVKAGAIQADWVLAKYGSAAEALAIDVPDLTSIHSWFTGFSDEYKRLCPNCKLGKVEFASTDLGTPKTASQIAGYVQANPGTNAIMMSVASIALGLPEALSALDYDGSVGVLNADEATRDYMRQGKITVSNSTDWATTVWKEIDTAARYMLGESVQPDLDAPENYFLYTADTIPEGQGYATPYVADYQDQFKKLWGLS